MPEKCFVRLRGVEVPYPGLYAYSVRFRVFCVILMCEQKDEPETSQYAEVVSTRNTDRPQPTHRRAPPPPAIYAQITHPPVYANQQVSLGSSTE